MSDRARRLLETSVFSLLSVGLYTAFPQFSDINTLWLRDHGVIAYPELPLQFEYPPLAALMWAPLSGLPSPRLAVLVNGLAMAFAAVGVTWLLLRLAKSNSEISLWTVSPALLMFLPINWDVAAVWLMTAALLLVVGDRPTAAGGMLGAGTALKVFPGALALPILPLLGTNRRRFNWLLGGGLTLGLSYAAYVVLAPETWSAHLDFASARTDYTTTIWGGLEVALGWFGVDLGLSTVNLLSFVATVASLLAVTIWVHRTRPSWTEAALIAMIAFIIFNKVFKPQYVLWVLPFMALAGSRRGAVRTMEGSAVLELVAVYTAPLAFVFPVVTVIRLACFGSIAWSVLRRYR